MRSYVFWKPRCPAVRLSCKRWTISFRRWREITNTHWFPSGYRLRRQSVPSREPEIRHHSIAVLWVLMMNILNCEGRGILNNVRSKTPYFAFYDCRARSLKIGLILEVLLKDNHTDPVSVAKERGEFAVIKAQNARQNRDWHSKGSIAIQQRTFHIAMLL